MGFEKLLHDSSRGAADAAASIVIDKPELLQEVFELCFSENKLTAMRVSRIFPIIGELHPEITDPFLPQLIENLELTKNESVIRNFLKLISISIGSITENNIGFLIIYCFKTLESGKQAIAIHVYCMQILYEISKSFPEIKPELVSVIEQRLPEGSMAIKTTASKILSKLYLEIIH